MKTTYNGTYTQVDELESTEGLLILKQRLKDDVLKDSLVRANFLSGAHFLKTLKDSNLLTIDEVIETNEEVSVVCKNSGFQQLGVFLEDSSQLKDSYLVELISKMLNCLDSLHKNSIYHQGLNPNSFVVDPKGNVKLTLFGTLEHRLYHHLPAIGNENPSIQNAIRFYSPERNENYGVVNQSSEYYSFGLIIWYLLCVQRNLSSHRDLVLSFPDFSFTGSIWDKALEACLNEDPKKRPKSAKEILGLLPIIDTKSSVSNPIKEKTPKKVNIIFFNYNSFHHEIKVDGNSIENYKCQILGRKLTIEVEEGVELQVFMKKDGSFLTSFTSSKRWQYTLPGNFDEVKQPLNKKESSYSVITIIVAIILIFLSILIFTIIRNGNDVNGTENERMISTFNEVVEEEHNIESQNITGIIYAPPSNLRSSPSDKSAIIEKCQYLNEEVKLLRKKGDWYYIKRKNNHEGYMHAGQITIEQNIETQNLVGIIYEPPSNLRSSPSDNSIIIDKCQYLNEEVKLLRKIGNWYYIRRNNNNEGYMHAGQMKIR
jgi:serine/threonine protein kinase